MQNLHAIMKELMECETTNLKISSFVVTRDVYKNLCSSDEYDYGEMTRVIDVGAEMCPRIVCLIKMCDGHDFAISINPNEALCEILYFNDESVIKRVEMKRNNIIPFLHNLDNNCTIPNALNSIGC